MLLRLRQEPLVVMQPQSTRIEVADIVMKSSGQNLAPFARFQYYGRNSSKYSGSPRNSNSALLPVKDTTSCPCPIASKLNSNTHRGPRPKESTLSTSVGPVWISPPST